VKPRTKKHKTNTKRQWNTNHRGKEFPEDKMYVVQGRDNWAYFCILNGDAGGDDDDQND
jgi:hypothetical protein